MGSSDNFCLRWNDFESNISTSFRELREDSEFLDVTLCCDNGVDVVQAHKVILAACSPLFRKILSRQKSQGQNPFLYLKGIRLKELRAVLDFIYHGEVNVAQDSLNNFLAVAEELAIKGLTTDSQKPGGGSGGGDPPNSEQRKKAVAKRKSVPQSSSAPVQIPVQAKKPKTDDDVEGIIEDVDVKGIKAEPEPSGSGVAAPNVPMVEAELDDSYGAGADDDNGDFGGGEEFEGFDQYGDGNEFDDSLGAAGASASAGADGKDFVQEEASFTKSQFGNPILVDSEGYTYTQHRVSNVNNATIYWRCVYHYKERGSCPARATTEGFYIKMKSKSHLHKPREPVVKRPHGNTKQARKIKAAQISAAVQEMSQELSKSKSNLSQK